MHMYTYIHIVLVSTQLVLFQIASGVKEIFQNLRYLIFLGYMGVKRLDDVIRQKTELVLLKIKSLFHCQKRKIYNLFFDWRVSTFY